MEMKGADMSNKPRSIRWMSAIVFLVICVPALAQDADKKTSAVANAWLGRDASDLLLQWPVDRGFSSYEDEASGETIYSWVFGIDEHNETRTYQTGQQMVGMMQGQGVSMPIYQPTYASEVVRVAAQTHCVISFTADIDGVISKYVYNGVKCRPYARSWGAPKAKS